MLSTELVWIFNNQRDQIYFFKNQPEMELRDRTGRIKKKSLIKLITEINKTKKFKSWVCFFFHTKFRLCNKLIA